MLKLTLTFLYFGFIAQTLQAQNGIATGKILLSELYPNMGAIEIEIVGAMAAKCMVIELLLKGERIAQPFSTAINNSKNYSNIFKASFPLKEASGKANEEVFEVDVTIFYTDENGKVNSLKCRRQIARLHTEIRAR